MSEKIYLNLLLLCGILSQGIIGTLADEDIRESSDILVRQKRVISRIPGEDRPIQIHMAPHVVMIKHNNRISCVGSILSHHVVITIAACVEYAPSEYHVVSNSARTSRGDIHNIMEIRKHYGGLSNRPADGIALLAVFPHFDFGTYVRPIELHSGPLLPGTLATVFGWGYNCGSADRGTNYARDLRSIEVTIISHRECVDRYQPHIEISEKDVCTYHPQKYCGHNDFGAGLVVDGYLAGVFLHSGIIAYRTNPQYPDVFVVLQHSDYKQWIMTNVNSIESQFPPIH